jgi:hypothetical protein
METTLIWRLRGATDTIVECFIEPKSPRRHAVTIAFGSETLLTEICPDAASATTRATQLRDRLLKTGHWKVTTGSGIPADSATVRAPESRR